MCTVTESGVYGKPSGTGAPHHPSRYIKHLARAFYLATC